jgi:hypothetical protein
MRRRALLTVAGTAFPSQPSRERGAWAKQPGPAPVPPPSRIFGVHVVKVRDLTQKLRDSGRAYGSEPQVSSNAAAWATGLLEASGAEPVKRALKAAASWWPPFRSGPASPTGWGWRMARSLVC